MHFPQYKLNNLVLVGKRPLKRSLTMHSPSFLDKKKKKQAISLSSFQSTTILEKFMKNKHSLQKLSLEHLASCSSAPTACQISYLE